MFRLAQISDTHLSPAKAQFVGNWAPLAAWIAAERPDFVIHTGDVTVDGAGIEADLRWCAELLGGLGIPLHSVPGNHDVGDSNHRHQPVTPERLARWSRHFGPDRWVLDIENWRLVGLDAMVIGSGLPQEAEQAAWLEAALCEAAGRPIACFLHRPLFLESPEEGDSGYWAMRPEPRRALLALFAQHRVALVASGHLHKAHWLTVADTLYVWCPSSAFLCGPATQPPMPGDKRLGAVRYIFDEAAVRAEIIDVPGLTTRWIDDVRNEVYPKHRDTWPDQTPAA